LEGLKNREADQKGSSFTLHYFFLSLPLADLRPSLFAVLAIDLKAAQKELLDEKSARLGVENSLAEEKAARQAAE
jgi:DNA repair exonuclease SbcCD ATPase subunit